MGILKQENVEHIWQLQNPLTVYGVYLKMRKSGPHMTAATCTNSLASIS